MFLHTVFTSFCLPCETETATHDANAFITLFWFPHIVKTLDCTHKNIPATTSYHYFLTMTYLSHLNYNSAKLQLNYVLFSLSWSSMLAVISKIHWWCVAVCVVNYMVNRRNCWSHSSTHLSDSQIFAENRDFCLPHWHSALSLWESPSEYCSNVWYRKTR